MHARTHTLAYVPRSSQPSPRSSLGGSLGSAVKLRVMLTERCTARCAYCHNEGQPKAGTAMLALAQVQRSLQALQSQGLQLQEVVLSGGEPTLHPDLAAIAQACQRRGAWVSLATHGGHPGLLRRALPWVDEVKVHIDDFDPQEQLRSMGIALPKALQSVDESCAAGCEVLINHPFTERARAARVLQGARALGVTCKLIALHQSAACTPPGFAELDWASLGYQPCGTQAYRSLDGQHQVLLKHCRPDPALQHYVLDARGLYCGQHLHQP